MIMKYLNIVFKMNNDYEIFKFMFKEYNDYNIYLN